MTANAFAFGKRRTVRATPNPLDKATIFSIYPREIEERHHTIQPGYFKIARGEPDNPSFLVVGPSSWWKETDEHSPLLEIPNSAVQVADAVVNSYCSGLLGFSKNKSQPGIFWVPGGYTVKDLKTNPTLIAELTKVKVWQDTYWSNLIKMADALWSKTGGNPLSISEDMRIAAKQIGVEKDWMQNFGMMEKVSCQACGSPRNPKFPVCPNCKAVVDTKTFEALGLKFAE